MNHHQIQFYHPQKVYHLQQIPNKQPQNPHNYTLKLFYYLFLQYTTISHIINQPYFFSQQQCQLFSNQQLEIQSVTYCLYFFAQPQQQDQYFQVQPKLNLSLTVFSQQFEKFIVVVYFFKAIIRYCLIAIYYCSKYYPLYIAIIINLSNILKYLQYYQQYIFKYQIIFHKINDYILHCIHKYRPDRMLKNYSSSNNNKQNISTNRSYMSSNKNHPSYQSISHEYKPTIRVGYSVTKINPPNNKTNKSTHNSNKNMLMNQIVTKTCKKMFQPTATTKNTNIQNQHKKRLATSRQLKSGKFIQGEYIKQTNKKSVQYHKKNVQESHDRYQSGHNVKQNIQNQFKNSRQRRSSRCYSTSSLHNSKVSQKVLPSYQNVGIKDIMQYQHAGKYRDTAITDKCTKSSAISRFLKYQQLNDYDFRKKPQFLRS